MSKATHTPGPWLAVDGQYRMQIWSERFWIANIKCEACPAHEEANAHLIAAAPELYEALVEIRDMLWSRPDISDRLRPLMGFAEEAINQKAAAALAKAEGTGA